MFCANRADSRSHYPVRVSTQAVTSGFKIFTDNHAEVFLTMIIAIFSPVKIKSGHLCHVINLCSTKLHLSTQQRTEKSRQSKTRSTCVHYFSEIRHYSTDSCAFQLHGLQPRALALYPAQPQIPASVSQRSLRPRGRLASGLRVTG